MKSIRAVLKQCNNKLDKYNTMSAAEYVPIKSIDVKFALYQQNNVEDMRYKDATHFALTREKCISDEMRIEVEDKDYDIVLINSFARQTQLFLKEINDGR